MQPTNPELCPELRTAPCINLSLELQDKNIAQEAKSLPRAMKNEEASNSFFFSPAVHQLDFEGIL